MPRTPARATSPRSSSRSPTSAARCSASRSRWSAPTSRARSMSASRIAKRWWDDENVDMVIGVPNSAIALALVKVAEEKNRILMPTAAATSALTGKGCGPNSIHFIYDTYGQTKTIVSALAKQGGDNWFFITVDYAFGLAIEQDATQFIKAAGGKVVGSVAPSAQHPGLLVVRAAGRCLEGQEPDHRQRRQRHHQRRQAGGRVRPDQEGHAHQHSAGAVPRHPRHRAEDRAGPADLEPVLLRHDSRGEAPTPSASPRRSAGRRASSRPAPTAR